MGKEKIDWIEAYEVAAVLCGIDPDSNADAVEEALANKFEIEPEYFETILQQLFKHLDFGVSPITNQAYVGFTREDTDLDNMKCWMIKKDCKQEFIHSVIGWISENKKLSDEQPELVRTITINGKPTYEVVLRNSTPEIQKSENIFRVKYEIYFHQGKYAGETKTIYAHIDDIECDGLPDYLIFQDYLTEYSNVENYFDVKTREIVTVKEAK